MNDIFHEQRKKTKRVLIENIRNGLETLRDQKNGGCVHKIQKPKLELDQ